jgi:hypothetical protein
MMASIDPLCAPSTVVQVPVQAPRIASRLVAGHPAARAAAGSG